MTCVIQIVPELAPETGGVADHAQLLKTALEKHGYETLFLAPQRQGRSQRKDLQEMDQDAAALVAALKDAVPAMRPKAIVLHYVGYGFEKRGCPSWLVKGLERCKQIVPLITIFHELYVSGPPWTTRFWLTPRQKNLVRRVSRLSMNCLVSSDAALKTLCRIDVTVSERSRVVPSPSSFGEPDRESWPRERKRQAVVLGLPPLRRRVYNSGGVVLARFCTQAGIEEVHDIGPPVKPIPASLEGVPVHAHGILAAEAISKFLLESRVLFTSYPGEYAAKSTIIAAGMAHGCAIFNCTEAEAAHDGWSVWQPANWDGRNCREVGEAGYELYHQRRNWSVVAEAIMTYLS